MLERNDAGGKEVFFVCGKYICLGEGCFLRRTSSCVVSFLDVRTNVESQKAVTGEYAIHAFSDNYSTEQYSAIHPGQSHLIV